MALRVLMLKKELDEKREALESMKTRSAELETREAELEGAISEAQTEEEMKTVEDNVTAFEADKEALEKEKAALEERVKELELEIANSQNERKSEPQGVKKVERKEEKKMEVRETKEYINAFANYIKTGKDTECRSLLTELATGGYVPVPTFVEKKIKTAWENNEIMSLVRKTYLKGVVRVGFELSATGAAIHEEGDDAPLEEVITLGIVTMTPESIKKWITISDEGLDLNGEEFLDYIYDEITYQIAKLAADTLIGMIADLDDESSATAVGAAQLTAAPALGTVAAAIARLSDEAARPVVAMNKLTWGNFKAVQYDGNYAVDPFEGLRVVFTSALPSYDEADDGDVYMIVGDFAQGAQANFPNGDSITLKYDDLSLAEKDLVKIVGREYVGMGIVAPFAFTNVLKPANP